MTALCAALLVPAALAAAQPLPATPVPVPDPGAVLDSALPLVRAAAEEPPAAAPAPQLQLSAAVGVAERLERQGETDAARALAGWVEDQPGSGSDGARARQLQAGLPPGTDRSAAAVRMVAWQTAAGAYLLGPNMIGLSEAFEDSGALVLGGSLLGGGLGAAGGLLMTRRPGFESRHVHALVGPQQLLTWNGIALGAMADDYHATYAAIGAGVVVGTGVGVAWALGDPRAELAAGLRAGSVWGTGLTMVGLSLTDGWNTLDYDRVPAAIALGTNAGALVGLALPAVLPVTVRHIRFATAGGAIGSAFAFGFAALTAEIIWYTPDTVAAVVGGAGVAGGAVAVLLSSRFEGTDRVRVGHALLSTDDGGRLRPSVALPCLSLAPTATTAATDPFPVDGTLHWSVPVVAHRF